MTKSQNNHLDINKMVIHLSGKTFSVPVLNDLAKVMNFAITPKSVPKGMIGSIENVIKDFPTDKPNKIRTDVVHVMLVFQSLMLVRTN